MTCKCVFPALQESLQVLEKICFYKKKKKSIIAPLSFSHAGGHLLDYRVTAASCQRTAKTTSEAQQTLVNPGIIEKTTNPFTFLSDNVVLPALYHKAVHRSREYGRLPGSPKFIFSSQQM